jgi:hypothetical protein
MTRKGPTMTRKGPTMTRKGPTMTRKGPTMTRKGPPRTLFQAPLQSTRPQPHSPPWLPAPAAPFLSCGACPAAEPAGATLTARTSRPAGCALAPEAWLS